MPKWLRKAFVVMVTILTFGLVTPPQSFLLDEAHAEKLPKKDTIDANTPERFMSEASLQLEQEETSERERMIKRLVDSAEEKSYLKFGAKIKPVIEDEFKDIILPNIEKVISTVAEQYEEENLRNLEITEQPGGGNSEKIFHIVDKEINQDIIRFHVRRDNPPQEGYWFNFHYHTFHDHFQEHYVLGSIYWDKNTPPKWLN
jgi:hypothetical protein